jgi:TolA-binding protein
VRYLSPVLLIVSLPACFVPIEAGRQMQTDIAALKSELQTLRHSQEENRAMGLEQTQQTLAKVEQLSRAVQDVGQNTRMTDADFNAQMEHMIRDVQELRGAVEVNEHRLGETETKLDKTLAMRITAMGQQNAATDVSPAPAAASAVVQKAPKGKKELLAYGIKLVKDGKADDGRSILRDVIKQYPREAGTTDAAYWALGESYSDEKKYDLALREYIKVVDKFATGGFVEGAYYKIALCSAETGNLEDAQTFLTELTSNHKKSAWFKKATAKLAEVNKRIEAKKARGKKGKP